MPTSKQRREAERRRLQRQVQRRAQRDVRRRQLLAGISVLGVLAVIAIVITVVVMGGDNKTTAGAGTHSTPAASSSPAPASSTRSTAAAPAYPCTWTKSGTASKTATVPPTTTPPKTGTATVSVQTNRGAMTFTLDRAKAPCAVESFVSLAGQHYFDNTSCHRLTSGGLSVLQCGDPTGTGSGGPGYSFRDELSGQEKYTRGVLAMANAGPNTNGSQFFIVYKDSQLPASYTVFGTVSKGLGVVDAVAAKGSTSAGDGKPKLPISLTKVLVNH
jgi:peptidyl-prolyl cis-trans isomerase B (cyclophilin B)